MKKQQRKRHSDELKRKEAALAKTAALLTLRNKGPGDSVAYECPKRSSPKVKRRNRRLDIYVDREGNSAQCTLRFLVSLMSPILIAG